MSIYRAFFVFLWLLFPVSAVCMEEVTCTKQQEECLSSLIENLPFAIEELYANIQHFPAFSEIAYPKNSESSYMHSLFALNNALFAKMYPVLGQFNVLCVKENRILLLELIRSAELQKLIANQSGVNPDFVRVLISRVIAKLVQQSKSSLGASVTISAVGSFWDDNHKELLLSLLCVEDFLLSSILRLQAHITNLVFYKRYYIDFICSHKVKYHTEVLNRIRQQHLPYQVAEIKEYAHFDCFKKQQDSISAETFLNDEKNLNEVFSDIRYLEQQKDPFYRKLAKQLFHEIYEKQTLHELRFLDKIFNRLHTCLMKREYWPQGSGLIIEKQITQLLKEFANTSNLKKSASISEQQEALFNFIKGHPTSNLLEIFLDYQGLSCLRTLPALCRLIEDICIVFSEPLAHNKSGIEGIFEQLDYSKHHNEQVRTVLTSINAFLHNYETEYLQLNADFLGLQSAVVHPLVRGELIEELTPYRLFDEHLYFGNKGAKEKSDQETVAYLMRTYFADELAPVKTVPNKKGKNHKKRNVRSQKTITTTTTAQRERKSLTNNSTQASDEKCAVTTVRSQNKMPRYHERVLRWFKSDFAINYPRESVLYHTFAPSADWFIMNEGTKSFWQDDNHYRSYSMPGRIINADNSFAYVIFSCTTLPTGEIYHRGYRFPTSQEWQQMGVSVEDFDHCNENEEQPFTLMQRETRVRNRSCIVSETEHSVVLFDQINNMYVQLYRHAQQGSH